ncbi:MAG: ribosome biogenesis GTP-binding protein YihA/YsxC [Fibrobacterales bacterium]
MIIHSAQFVKGAVNLSGIPEDDFPQIAFAGRSNVGKSSLQNALLNRKKLVKTSSTPGKTREINFFLINEKFYFVDLPGLGYAKLSKKLRGEISDFIGDYVFHSKNLRAVIYLIDIRTSGTAIDITAIQHLLDTEIPVLLILTKQDKLNAKERNKAVKALMEKLDITQKPLMVSSFKKIGLDTVWSAIEELFALDDKGTA